MTEHTFWINLLLWALFGLGVCCLLAVLSESVRAMFASIFAIFYRPFSQIQERTSAYLQGARGWLLQQIEDESDRKGDGPIYFIVGSVLYSLLTALFVLCDFGLIVLTVQAMGMDEPRFQLPLDTSTLTAATLVTSGLFWGAILFDLLGVTCLAPWRKRLSGGIRKLLIALSIFFVAAAVAIAVFMTYWRGVSLNEFVREAEAAPSDFLAVDQGALSTADGEGVDLGMSQSDFLEDEDLAPVDSSSNWIVPATLMGISGISLASTAFSMVGLAILAKFVILLVISLGALLLLPAVFAAWLVSLLLNLLFSAVQSILDLFIEMGNGFLRLFGRSPANPSTGPSGAQTGPPAEPDRAQSRDTGPAVEAPSADPGFNPFFTPRRKT